MVGSVFSARRPVLAAAPVFRRFSRFRLPADPFLGSVLWWLHGAVAGAFPVYVLFSRLLAVLGLCFSEGGFTIDFGLWLGLLGQF